MNPEKENPSFYQFSCTIVHIFFGDPKFWRLFCPIFLWTSVTKLIRSQLSVTAKTTYFESQTTPQARKSLILSIFCGIVHEFLMIQNFDVSFAQIFCAWSLRHYLGSHLALTAKTIYFQGQTSREAGKPLILQIFVCYSPRSFWWSKIPTSFFAQSFC